MTREARGERCRGLRWSGGESGAGAIRTVLTLAFVVSVAYAGIKFVPVKAAAFRFEDAIREQVVLAAVRRRRITEPQVRNLIVERAVEFGLPVEKDDVSVRIGKSTVRVRVAYEVAVRLPLGYVYDWAFLVEEEAPLF